MRYLLSTNIVITLSKGVPALQPLLRRCPASDMVLSSVVLAQIEYGIAKSARKDHNRQVFAALLTGFLVLPFDEAAARDYGLIRAELESAGRLIGPNDLMIAAHARSHDLTAVTENESQKRRKVSNFRGPCWTGWSAQTWGKSSLTVFASMKNEVTKAAPNEIHPSLSLEHLLQRRGRRFHCRSARPSRMQRLGRHTGRRSARGARCHCCLGTGRSGGRQGHSGAAGGAAAAGL